MSDTKLSFRETSGYIASQELQNSVNVAVALLMDSGGSMEPNSRLCNQLFTAMNRTSHFNHTVWLNPIPATFWERGPGSYTIQIIREIFPIFELSIEGL